jgi:hypothetical protein
MHLPAGKGRGRFIFGSVGSSRNQTPFSELAVDAQSQVTFSFLRIS